MTDQQYQQFLTIIQNDGKAVMFQAPSIILRTGQRGRVEAVREIGLPNPKQHTVGFSQDIIATFSGELIRVDGLIEIGVFEGVAVPGGFEALGFLANGAAVPQYFKTEYEVWFPDRWTGLFVADSPQPEGFVTLVCLTSTQIDPAWHPLHESESDLLRTRWDQVKQTGEKARTPGKETQDSR